MLRKILQRLSRRRAFKRRLPAAFGRAAIYVSPDAGLKYWTTPLNKVDPLLLSLAEQLVCAGESAWDIGANVGLFTFAAAVKAGPAGHLLAVEADTWLVDLLRRTSRLRQPVPMAPVDIIPAAADSEPGLATFQVAERGRASNSLAGLGMVPMGGVRESHRVVAVSLDWLLGHCRRPQIVKIDVEGAELRVLNGAKRILHEVRPTLLMEVGENNAAEIGRLFQSNDYDVYDGAAAPRDRHPLERAPWDLIAVPRENTSMSNRITSTQASSALAIPQAV